jgi:hypothetical protein
MITVTIEPIEGLPDFAWSIRWPNGGSMSGPARSYGQAVHCVMDGLMNHNPFEGDAV